MGVQKLLEQHNYNTLDNLLEMFEGFQGSGCSSLMDYYHTYTPPITSSHHTCVGQALELWQKLSSLDDHFPLVSSHFQLASCEESVSSIDEYTAIADRLESKSYKIEKEHVLLSLRFEIDGRPGVLLCDPGYHIGRVITVMSDGMYPHTGWFVQTNEKEYCYRFVEANERFVEWTTRTTRNGVTSESRALVYVMRPYLTAVDVTERRNLVYDCRSLLARDMKGHLVAGVFFKFREESDEFTIFCSKHGKRRERFRFSMFRDLNKVEESVLKAVKACNEELNLPEGSLLQKLHSVYNLWSNKSFLRELLDINKSINNMAFKNRQESTRFHMRSIHF